MPDWSPVRRFGGYQSASASVAPAILASAATDCCASACGVHGHSHAWTQAAAVSDDRSFWGALGCSCWAF
jgi:hypothetical protein